MRQSAGFPSLCPRVVPALMVLVALAALTVSCSLLDTSGGAGGALSTGLLSQVPDGYQEVTRWDVAGLLQAEGLQEVQDDFRDQWEWIEEYGIFMDDVSELVRATDDRDDTLVLIAGQFDWEDILDDLDDAGFRDDTYRDVEIWEDRNGDVVVGLLEERNQIVLSTSGSAGVRDTTGVILSGILEGLAAPRKSLTGLSARSGFVSISCNSARSFCVNSSLPASVSQEYT